MLEREAALRTDFAAKEFGAAQTSRIQRVPKVAVRELTTRGILKAEARLRAERESGREYTHAKSGV